MRRVCRFTIPFQPWNRGIRVKQGSLETTERGVKGENVGLRAIRFSDDDPAMFKPKRTNRIPFSFGKLQKPRRKGNINTISK